MLFDKLDRMLRRRKLIPTAAERLVWGRGSGDSLNVVDVGFGKIGGLIWYVPTLAKPRAIALTVA